MDDTILSLKNISVTFDGFKALQNVSTDIKKGELRFFIGPNGAGKTTLLDIICGKVKPSSGNVIFKGKSILKEKENEIANIGIGRKFQVPSVFSNLTVYENMQLSYAPKKTLLNSLFGREVKQEEEKIEEVLAKTGLTDYKDAVAKTLSHGQKQWLEIAMLLVTGHSLLLMDEPVAGLGRTETDKIGELLKDVAKTCSVIVVEHDMEFVRNFASSVTVLNEGKVLCEGPMEQVQKDPRVIEVYLGRGKVKDA